MLLHMDSRTPSRSALALLALTCCTLSASAAVAAATARAASVSANWAGYVATPTAGAARHFTSVSGSWTQPSATCSSGKETDSAVWVGLGGYSEAAAGLEQVGTDADCTRSGSPVYSSWFELLPAEPVNLKLAVHPGDTVVASVTVAGHDVTLRIRNLTTGARFSITRGVTNVDTSSADWIVEAPSVCTNSQTCNVLALTDFGQVAFSSATAVARGHTGAILDPGWSATALELQQRAFTSAGGRAGARVVPTRTLTVAAPSPSGGADGAFTVNWQQQSVQIERGGAPRLPGFGGGSP
jgi:hypothetical protein